MQTFGHVSVCDGLVRWNVPTGLIAARRSDRTNLEFLHVKVTFTFHSETGALFELEREREKREGYLPFADLATKQLWKQLTQSHSNALYS